VYHLYTHIHAFTGKPETLQLTERQIFDGYLNLCRVIHPMFPVKYVALEQIELICEVERQNYLPIKFEDYQLQLLGSNEHVLRRAYMRGLKQIPDHHLMSDMDLATLLPQLV
jgi:hypothetical protein